jgi:hypothetical protein
MNGAVPPSVSAPRNGSGHPARLGGYVLVMVGYGAAVAGLAALARATGRRMPNRIPASDLAMTAVATFKISRLITKAGVTRPLRAPFTDVKEVAGEGAERTPPRCRNASRRGRADDVSILRVGVDGHQPGSGLGVHARLHAGGNGRSHRYCWLRLPSAGLDAGSPGLRG